MIVRFWGTRGSIPTTLTAADIREKVTAALLASRGKDLRSEGQIRTFVQNELPFHVAGTCGGNTPCVEIVAGSEEYLVFDGGSGIRGLGNSIMKSGPEAKTIHIFLSHLHYDHIQGLPFFSPAYIPGNRIVFHGGHDDIEKALAKQMEAPYFPIDVDVMGAELTYEKHAPGDQIDVADCRISLYEQDHPGISYGFRVEHGTKSVVYSTDGEHRLPAHGKAYSYVDFIRNVDLLVFDAPYTLSQSIGSREDWGHSSNIMGVELAARGNVKKLALFHHDPAATDTQMSEFLKHTEKFLSLSQQEIKQTRAGIPGIPPSRTHPNEVLIAYDGLEMNL
tara:strand:- start:1149 stop:2150 length:1002 start_codon:yes stop_codon:yes gene_type:complete